MGQLLNLVFLGARGALSWKKYSENIPPAKCRAKYRQISRPLNEPVSPHVENQLKKSSLESVDPPMVAGLYFLIFLKSWDKIEAV